MRILAFGDIHMELGRFKEIPGIDTADLLLLTGDLTNYGGKKDARRMLDSLLAVNENILALPGNLDEKEVGDYLEALGLSLHGRGVLYGTTGLFGVGGSNITPFNTPMEFSEDQILTALTAGYEQVQDAGRLVMVSHAPPLDTRADMLSNGIHVGSRSVRTVIEQKKPALCLTGHIHEARGEDWLGPTHILNPGMIKDGGYIEVLLENHEPLARLLTV